MGNPTKNFKKSLSFSFSTNPKHAPVRCLMLRSKMSSLGHWTHAFGAPGLSDSTADNKPEKQLHPQDGHTDRPAGNPISVAESTAENDQSPKQRQ
jgi:hypothetical protein